MARHNKIDHLSEAEIAKILAAATALNEALTRPLIATSCAHYKAKTQLNQAMKTAIQEITGDDPPWTKTPASHWTVGQAPPR